MQIQFFLLLILLKAPVCGVSYVICYGSSDCYTIQVVKVDLNFTVQPHARCHSAFPAVPVFHCIVNKSVLNEPTKTCRDFKILFFTCSLAFDKKCQFAHSVKPEVAISIRGDNLWHNFLHI